MGAGSRVMGAGSRVPVGYRALFVVQAVAPLAAAAVSYRLSPDEAFAPGDLRQLTDLFGIHVATAHNHRPPTTPTSSTAPTPPERAGKP